MPLTRKRNHSGNSSPLEVKRAKVSVAEVGKNLLDFTKALVRTTGDSADIITKLPRRKTSPDYYQLVQNPIELATIETKLDKSEYTDVSDLIRDFKALCDNIILYFKKNSPEQKFAIELWGGIIKILTDSDVTEIPDLDGQRLPRERNSSRESSASREKGSRESSVTRGLKIKLETDDVRSYTPEPDYNLQQACCFLFATVATATDGSRDTCTMFQLLPSKERYPEYYLVIQEPIDLKIIAERIKQSQHRRLSELIRDFELMCRNAKTFNEPGSQVYKDATAIQKLVAVTVQSIEMRRVNINAKVNGQVAATIVDEVAAYEYIEDERLAETAVDDVLEEPDADEVDESDFDSDADEEPVDEGNLFMSLFNAVRNYKDQTGACISEPFTKLPSKKIYPDYFDEIKKPICLNRIHKKISGGKYSSLLELESDLQLVFKNAMAYNADESQIFQDATILLNIMKTKASELTQYEIQSEYGAVGGSIKTEVGGSQTPAAKDSDTPRSTKRTWTYRDHLRRRLVTVYKALLNYKDHQRNLIENFMNLPSKFHYPDYYQVILKPIDMQMVKSKIKLYEYKAVNELLIDLNQMFENAKQYNEPSSLIYSDAVRLQEVLTKKVSNLKELVPKDGQDSFPSLGRTPKIPPNLDVRTASQMQQLFDAIFSYRDSRDRQISAPFVKLPSKHELPDYYDVIKQPIDLQRVKQKIDHNKYGSIEDLMNDFNLVFDNACKYNQPESLIYKDALTLQRVCIQKKAEICEDGSTNKVPNVMAAVQELLTNLFITVYNHEDTEGRCFSDSFAELTDAAHYSDRPKTPLTFDQIKCNLDKGRYRRLDRFQQDMFQVFDFARKVSPLNSQLYEDARELQEFFIRMRDDLCASGGAFFSPALHFTMDKLKLVWLEDKEEKLEQNFQDDEEEEKEKMETEDEGLGDEGSLSFQEETYNIGDFLYLHPKEAACEPHIVVVKRLWSDADGKHLQCGYFYRPSETKHPRNKKFLDKEVFLTRAEEEVNPSKVVGRCFVMRVQDYFKMKPNDFNGDDVYVCESRYEQNLHIFKKIKDWRLPENSTRLEARDAPLKPERIPSIFADASTCPEKDDKELASTLEPERLCIAITDPLATVVEGEDPVSSATVAPEEQTCYEQFVLSIGCFKLGDCVYVRSDEQIPYIARIDRIWANKNGEAYFYGPWFVRPSEIEHLPTRMFYRKELFLSSIADPNPLLSVISKCSVLSHRDYCTMRLTDVMEEDVYICESKYCENEKAIRKLSRGLRKHSLSTSVCHDEVYYFKKEIVPEKEPSPLLPSDVSAAYVDQYNLDPSMGYEQHRSDSVASGGQVRFDDFGRMTDPAKRNKPKKKKSNFSGYILYSGEIRKAVQDDRPEASFGEISRAVGEKWRMLSQEEKSKYEARARSIMEEQRRKDKEAEQAMYRAMAQARPSPAHSTSPGAATLPQQQQSVPAAQSFQWVQQPSLFVNAQGQLIQYQAQPTVSGGQVIQQPRMVPAAQSVIAMPQPQSVATTAPQLVATSQPTIQTRPPVVLMQLPSGQQVMATMPPQLAQQQPQAMATPSGAALPPATAASTADDDKPEPLFHTLPPRPTRIHHSDAYIRYVQAMKTGNRHLSNWQKQLKATRENTPISAADLKVPSNWLVEGTKPEEVVSALWNLRDTMLRDSLQIQRNVDFEDL